MVTKKILYVNLSDFGSTFEMIGSTDRSVFIIQQTFLLKPGVTSASFSLLRNSPVFSAWLKKCCSVLGVTIALVFNTFGGIFLWIVAFLLLKFFIYFLFQIEKLQYMKIIFLRDVIFNYQNTWMNLKFCYSSINRIYHVIGCFVCDMSVFSNI